LGFEVDLAEELSKHMNLKLEKIKVNPKTWGPMLISGQIDAALCRIVHSRFLENEFDFSEPYFFDIPCILVNRGAAKSIQDFKGTKLAVVQGSTYEKLAMNILKSLNDENAQKNVYSYPDRPSCFLGFTKDKVNGWLESGMVLIEYASKNTAKFEVIPISDKTESIAVALPQNDSAWRDLINFTIQDMSSDGSFKKIYDKWFGQDTPYMFPLKRTIEVWPE
jgi:polar amino acid transport system substrate-binding protein